MKLVTSFPCRYSPSSSANQKIRSIARLRLAGCFLPLMLLELQSVTALDQKFLASNVQLRKLRLTDGCLMRR